MSDNDWRNARIEDAAKAIAAFTDPDAWQEFRGEARAALAVFEKAHTREIEELTAQRDHAEEMCQEWIKIAEAHTPTAHEVTSDEREALAVLISEYINETDDCGDLPHTRGLAEQILAGFRRSEVPGPTRQLRECVICGEKVTMSNATEEWEKRHKHAEPSKAGPCARGDHETCRVVAGLGIGSCGCECHRSEPQGEPSDAQEAVRRLKDSGVGAYVILAAVTKVYDMEPSTENPAITEIKAMPIEAVREHIANRRRGAHEFREDTDDYSMCVCGVPADVHDRPVTEQEEN